MGSVSVDSNTTTGDAVTMYHEINIESDEAEIEPLLHNLAQQVVGSGGFLHPELKIRINQGQIMVASSASSPGPLVRLPGSCLLPVDEVKFELDGDDIVVSSYASGYERDKRAMLDTLIAIYNYGKKIRHHRGEMPWLAFAETPELLDTLYQARADGPRPNKFYKLAKEGNLEQLALESFIDSRTLHHLFSNQPPQSVLMPFIDCFNHHVASPSFGSDGDAVLVNLSRPVTGSTECFVRYNMLDAMDTYLNYGFVDASAPFLRSVPVHIDLSDIGTIHILGRASQPGKQPPPPALKDLRALLPSFAQHSDNELTASHLFIPGYSAPKSMHRILGTAIQHLAPHIAPEDLRTRTNLAVQQVLTCNEDYYIKLSGQLSSMKNKPVSTLALSQLKRLIKLQQQRLTAYREMLELLSRAG